MGGRAGSVEQIPIKHRAKSRQWSFRVAALGLVCIPFLAAEFLLALFDPSWARQEEDPLVGFSETKPLFEIDQQANIYRIRQDRLRAFVQNGFPATKHPDTFRIFCLGGSTVQGRPYSIETSFTTWLRLSLEAAHPNLNIEVINCGGVSYASYRLTPILRECLQLEPDLILLCSGNNEFLEDRSYAFTKKTMPILDPAFQILSHSRIVRCAMAIGSRWAHKNTRQATLGPEVDAMLDYERGIERYHRNDSWRQSVEEHFRINIQNMIRTCRRAKVPIMLLSPCVNLKDSPPFKSQHQTNLNAFQRTQWKKCLTEASVEIQKGNLMEAFALLQQALQQDPKHAMTWYQAGKLLYQSGKFQQAEKYFEKALEEDICPLRIRSNMRTMLSGLAQMENIPFYDMHETATKMTPTGITGNEFLVDHVHPSITGHQIIGKELAVQIQTRWLNEETVEIPSEILQQRFQDYLKTLPDHYFANGLQRLQNLQAWTQGRADGAPIESLPKPEQGL